MAEVVATITTEVVVAPQLALAAAEPATTASRKGTSPAIAQVATSDHVALWSATSVTRPATLRESARTRRKAQTLTSVSAVTTMAGIRALMAATKTVWLARVTARRLPTVIRAIKTWEVELEESLTTLERVKIAQGLLCLP